MKKKFTRRNFVKTTIAGTAAVAVTPTIGCANLGNPYDPKNLPTRMLGNTGVRVPLIGYGCGSRWMSEQNDDLALEILETALNRGVYYWDTASTYKNDRLSSEERIGKILPSLREQVFLVSKTNERDADKAKEIIERSLQRLGTDYIDLYHVHSIQSVEDAESLGDQGKVLEVLHDYKSQGIIKHIGFTGHTSAEGMKRAAELYDFEVMMIALNHHVKNRHEPFEESPVPYAATKGIGVVAMKVIRPRETVQGISARSLIRYALTADNFTIANIGCESMQVLKENLALVENFEPLSSEEFKDVQAALTPFFESRHLAWMHPSYEDGMMDPGSLKFMA